MLVRIARQTGFIDPPVGRLDVLNRIRIVRINQQDIVEFAKRTGILPCGHQLAPLLHQYLYLVFLIFLIRQQGFHTGFRIGGKMSLTLLIKVDPGLQLSL